MTNQERLVELWDDARDGVLSPQDQREFESLLAADAQAKAMWDAESGWLSMLEEDDADLRQGAGRDAFVSGVIHQWQTGDANPVVGRIGFGKVRGWVMGIAATLLLVVGVSLWVKSQQATPVEPGPGPVAVENDQPDAIALLMSSTRESYAAVVDGPSRLKETVTNPGSLLDVNQLVGLFDNAVPDPKDYVAPRRRL